MTTSERYSRNHRRKTPSFSSSLLDSILRSIDETNDRVVFHEQQPHNHNLIEKYASEPKPSHKTQLQQQTPSLGRAIMIDQWMETRHNRHGNLTSCNKFSSDSSSSGAETPITYRSLPNSFTISRKTAETIFLDDSTVKPSSVMKSTKLRAMKIYGDLKKVKQPISPGSKISTFIYSLFTSSSFSSKKAKIEDTMQNFRSLKKSRSVKQDTTTMTCTSFSRSCMSKKQHSNSVKRSVRFYPVNETVILDHESVHERDSIHSNSYMKNNYKNFMVNVEDESENEDEDEDDLFELPVFETTDLTKIRV